MGFIGFKRKTFKSIGYTGIICVTWELSRVKGEGVCRIAPLYFPSADPFRLTNMGLEYAESFLARWEI